MNKEDIMLNNLSELAAHGRKRLEEIRSDPNYPNGNNLEDVKVAIGSKVSGKVPFPDKYSEAEVGNVAVKKRNSLGGA